MKFIEIEEAYRIIRDELKIDHDHRKDLRDAFSKIPVIDPVDVLKRVDTKCWTCRNAVCGCDWSIRFKPIDGWLAVRNDIKVSADTVVESYIVLDCPYYENERLKDEDCSSEL